MAEMYDAAPTRPFGQQPPTEPSTDLTAPADAAVQVDASAPADAVAPAKRLALMKWPGEPTAPDPSDIQLFEDIPAPLTPTAYRYELPRARNRSYGCTKAGFTKATGSARPGRRRAVVHPFLGSSRPTRLGVLIGVAALLCGVVAVAVAAQPGDRGQTAAPVTEGASVPALRGSPPAARENPPKADDSADQSRSVADSAATDLRRGTANKPPSAPVVNVPGSISQNEDDSGTDTDKGKGKEKDTGGNKNDAMGGTSTGPGSDSGAGADSGSGSGSGSVQDPGTGVGPGTGPGTGGDGSAARPPARSALERALQAINYPNRYWHVRGDGLGYLDTVAPGTATFEVVPGLADSECYSFSLSDGRYLRHWSFRLRAATDDGSSTFEKDATFCPRPAQRDGSVMLESSNYPGRFIRHRDYQLWLDPFQRTDLYRADSSFRMVNG
jgi:hypothetical protein